MKKHWLILILLLMVSARLDAAKVRVHFVDQDNKPLGEVDAKIVNTQGEQSQVKKANKKGELTYDKVAAGAYELLSQKTGYVRAKSSGIQVANADIDVNVKMASEEFFRQTETAANAAFQQKNLKDALSGYQRLLDISPDNAVTWSNVARVHALENAWDKALEAAQKAAATDPGQFAAFAKQIESFANYARGRDYLEQKDYPKAVEALTKALEIDPANADTLYVLALAYGHQKKYPEAIKYAEEALKLKSDDAEFKNLVRILKNNAAAEAKK